VKPTHFATPAEFRRWLAKNHKTVAELWVGFYRKGSGRPSITWPESVDEALCFGWIDGLRKSVDDESYMIRFTPRRKTSTWSNVNAKRMAELIAAGRVKPAGLAAWEARQPHKTGVYLFEQKGEASLDPLFEKRFQANRKAWEFFTAQPPGYRKIATRYVMSAKQEATRERRLETLIKDSAAGLRIGLLRRPDQP
jgi:uncharacterized protein YdeI (YjbR/CyaY-like superfamily)